MKCVMNVDDGYIDRVPDDVAHKLVTQSALYIYCSKSEWKKQRQIQGGK